MAVGYLSPTVPVRSVWPACVSHARGRPPWPIDVPKETPRCRQTVSPVAGRSFALGQTRVRSKTATDGCGSFVPSRGRWVDSLWGSLVAVPGSGVKPGFGGCESEIRARFARRDESYLVDPASSHMLVSKIKPCMSKYKLLYCETANGSLNQLSSI